MKRITWQMVLSWRPCSAYPEERLKKIYGKRGLTPLQVCNLRGVSVDDKFWTLLRPEVFDDRTLRLLACDFAESVLPIFEKERPDDKRPRECLRIARAYTDGAATAEELAAAGAAAWDAAMAAAGAAARAAARDAEQKKQLAIVRKACRTQTKRGTQ